MRTQLLVLSTLITLMLAPFASASDSCTGRDESVQTPTGQTIDARALACDYSYPHYQSNYRDASIGVYDPVTGVRAHATGSASEWTYTNNNSTDEYEWRSLGVYVHDERGNLVPTLYAYVGDGSSNGYDYGYASAYAQWGPFYQSAFSRLP